MGFGILVIGYLALFGMMPSYNVYISYASLIPIIGCLVLIIALQKLAPYGRLFDWSLKVSYVLLGIAGVGALYEFGALEFLLTRTMGLAGWSYAYSIGIFAFKLLCLATFNTFLLNAISKLAESVGNKKLAYKSKRNLAFQMIYYALAILAMFPIAGDFWGIFGLLIYIFGIVCFFLNLVTIYTAYMRIYLGDEA